MKIHQIRNATIVLNFGDKNFLIDPMLAPKEYYSPIFNREWPFYDLPLPVKDIVKNIDAVIITSLHNDHFDEFAEKALSNSTKIFVQDKFDKNALEKSGFKNVEVISKEGSEFYNIKLLKTDCLQGIRALSEPVFLANGMRWESMGVVFKSENEPTVYFTGDTLWFDGIKNAIDTHKPDYAVLNTGCNIVGKNTHTTFGINDIEEFHNYAPDIKLIGCHLDNLDNAELSRTDIRTSNLCKSIYLPADGEIMIF